MRRRSSANVHTAPMTRQPRMLTTNVLQGNVVPNVRCTAPASQKRASAPSAPASASQASLCDPVTWDPYHGLREGLARGASLVELTGWDRDVRRRHALRTVWRPDGVRHRPFLARRAAGSPAARHGGELGDPRLDLPRPDRGHRPPHAPP